MNWYLKTKFAQQYPNEFEDMFGDLPKSRTLGNIAQLDRRSEPYLLELYRGFDADLNSLERQGDDYVLSPEKSEQGMIWFTHQFINGYNPMEYVSGRGNWLLTYPLETVKHYDEVVYEDGSVRTNAPEDIIAQAEPTENSRFSCFGNYCIELPDGWYWTYKTEKFIGTTNRIVVSQDMLRPNG